MAESTALQETQSIGIHDVLFEKVCKALWGDFKRASFLMRENLFWAKQKDRLEQYDFFSYFECF